jgi:hypothetical protein
MRMDEQTISRDRAALERIVNKYDLRWDHDPTRRYPVNLDFVGEGWAELVEKLVIKLIALGWDRRVAQVKEKFGMLRFYIGEGTAPMFEAVDVATTQSATTCERCGAARAARRRRCQGSPSLIAPGSAKLIAISASSAWAS